MGWLVATRVPLAKSNLKVVQPALSGGFQVCCVRGIFVEALLHLLLHLGRIFCVRCVRPAHILWYTWHPISRG